MRTKETVYRLKMTVAVAPNDETTQRELALLRAALLYADDVDLISPTVELIQQVQKFGRVDDDNFLPWLAGMDAKEATYWGLDVSQWDTTRQFLAMTEAQFEELIEEHKLATGLSPLELAEMDAIVTQVREARIELPGHLIQLRNQLQRQAEETGFEELRPALDSGLLRLKPAGGARYDMESGEQMDEMISVIAATAQDSRRYLLTDDIASMLVETLIESGRLTLPGRAQGNATEAQLNSGLVEALPALPGASLGQILEIREDLRAQLGYYRAEVAELAESVRSSPYGDDMRAEVSHAWITKVEPALNDLEASMGRNAVVKSVLKRVGLSTVGPLATASLYAGGSILFGFMPGPETLLAAATATAGEVVGEGVVGWADRNAVKKEPFYFLYEANGRVAGQRRSGGS